MKTGEQKQRYFALDRIRAIALLNMIAYHTIWDLVYLFGFGWKWFQSDVAYIWQQAICWTFIFLSGFCQSLGNETLKRGLQISFVGLLISVVTNIVIPQSRVLFGVITLLGSCMLITLPLECILKKCNSFLGFSISVVIFLLTRNITIGFLGFESWNIMELPDSWYRNFGTAYLGFLFRLSIRQIIFLCFLGTFCFLQDIFSNRF